MSQQSDACIARRRAAECPSVGECSSDILQRIVTSCNCCYRVWPVDSAACQDSSMNLGCEPPPGGAAAGDGPGLAALILVSGFFAVALLARRGTPEVRG